MKASIGLFALIIFSFFSASFTSENSVRNAWKKLGSTKVNFTLDRDVIHVGPHDGKFTKLKVLVSGASVNIHKMVVEYGNGSRDIIPLQQTFRKGSDSRIIDLEGGKRIIKNITFIYDTKNRAKRRATVSVFGRK